MKCVSRKEGDIIVFDINDDIVFSSLGEIRETMDRELAGPDSGKVLINLSNVGMIDSAGIGFIVSVYKSLLTRKGFFGLINPNESVKSVLQTVGLTRLFKVFDTEDEAVKSA